MWCAWVISSVCFCLASLPLADPPSPPPPLPPSPPCQTLLLPSQWQSEVDMQSVVVRSKPFSDAEELQPVCYRCSTVNPLLNTQVGRGRGGGKGGEGGRAGRLAHTLKYTHPVLRLGRKLRPPVWRLETHTLPPSLPPQGDYCINCGAPFIRSFATFEHLPLVEFELNSDIPDDEAARLLGEDAGVDTQRRGAAGSGGGGKGGSGGGANVLRLDEDDMIHHIDDAFSAQQMVPNTTIRVDRATLRRMKNAEVGEQAGGGFQYRGLGFRGHWQPGEV